MERRAKRQPGPKQPGEGRINWIVLLSFVAAGLIALIGGWLVAYDATPFREEHAAYWSGLLVNVGTTLLLAAALVWFERVLVRRVRTQNDRAIVKAADQAAEATANLIGPRIDELENSIRADAAARASGRTESAERVATLPTFEAIETALGRAAEINAVRMRAFPGSDEKFASIVVPGGAVPSSPRLGIVRVPRSASRPARIVLTHGGDEIVWEEGMEARDAFGELNDKMTVAGYAEQAGSLSAGSFFANCSLLLRDAIAARQNDEGRWLSGSPAIELIATDWVITQAGIEVRGRGIVAAKEDFGTYSRGSSRRIGVAVPHEPPHDLDADLWALARERALAALVGSPFPHLESQQPPPWWVG
ncbi:hypothetical protein [Microbacterium testaceum]|uniref:hypothetical protein n=1 Tax=Microbacterium testaceum TaxID=2033 RepID=UPI000B2730C8|nr:hypothetical protein [Microbacterium testaceum]